MRSILKTKQCSILFSIAFFFPIIADSGDYQTYAHYHSEDAALFGHKHVFYCGPRDPVEKKIGWGCETVYKTGSAGIGAKRWDTDDTQDAVFRAKIWANAFGHITCKITIYYQGAWQDGIPVCDPYISEVEVCPSLVKPEDPIYVKFMLSGISGSTIPVKILVAHAQAAGKTLLKKQKTLGLGFHEVRFSSNNFSEVYEGNHVLQILVKPPYLSRWVYGVGTESQHHIKFQLMD